MIILTPFDLVLVAVALFIIMGVALFNIYAHFIDDGWLGRLLYMATAGTCAVGLFNLTDRHVLAVVVFTQLFIFALRQLRNIVLRSWWHLKYRGKYASPKR